MYSSSRIQLIGNLGQDPERKESSDGTHYVRAQIATHERWKDDEGRARVRTDWHTVFFWGRLADIAGKYLKKGSYVSVDGTLRRREYKDTNGVIHRVWEIRAQGLGLLDRMEKGEDGAPETPAVAPLAELAAIFDTTEEELAS